MSLGPIFKTLAVFICFGVLAFSCDLNISLVEQGRMSLPYAIYIICIESILVGVVVVIAGMAPHDLP